MDLKRFVLVVMVDSFFDSFSEELISPGKIAINRKVIKLIKICRTGAK
jgi:hypothetical protein